MSWDGESIVAAIGVVATLGFQQWTLHRATQREREADAKKVADAIDRRDERFDIILQEYPLHRHREDATESCLRPSGIDFPKAKVT